MKLVGLPNTEQTLNVGYRNIEIAVTGWGASVWERGASVKPH